MFQYNLLEPNCYYLIQEKPCDKPELIKVTLVTDACMFVTRFKEVEVMEWRLKSDPIHEIYELLSDEAVQQWRSIYYNSDEYDYEDDE